MSFILNLLFPKNCIFCNVKGLNICDNCVNRKLEKVEQVCHVCRRKVFKKGLLVHTDCQKFTSLDGIVSVYKYNKAAKYILRLIKYDGYYDIISDVSKSLEYQFSNLPFGYDFAIPVPIHKSRLRDRGFNQAEILIKKLTWNYKNILIRSKNTKPQAGLNKENRSENVKDAFSLIDTQSVMNKKILLFDDVFTTGATLENCSKILKSEGASRVYALTWAKD